MQKLKPITIPYYHLSPPLKEIVGHPLSGGVFALFARVYGVDKAIRTVLRWVYRQSIADAENNYGMNVVTGKYGVSESRYSKTVSELRLALMALNLYNRAPHAASLAGTVVPTQLVNRTEAVKIVQYCYEKLSKQMRHTKAVVSPRALADYPPEVVNAELLSKTHPIFRVNVTGSITFLPMSRMEYARYVFQQKRLGKLGIQPWLWRGYLDVPNAPVSWKKEAAQKVREWSEKIRERWTPSPVPRPALVRYNSARLSPRKIVPRALPRKR